MRCLMNQNQTTQILNKLEEYNKHIKKGLMTKNEKDQRFKEELYKKIFKEDKENEK